MVHILNNKQHKYFPHWQFLQFNFYNFTLISRFVTDWTSPVPATTPVHLADHQTFHQSSVLLSNRNQTCKITQSQQNTQETRGRAPKKEVKPFHHYLMTVVIFLLQYKLNDCITYAFLVGKHFGGCQDVGIDEGLINSQECLVPICSNPGGSSSIPGPYTSYNTYNY